MKAPSGICYATRHYAAASQYEGGAVHKFKDCRYLTQENNTGIVPLMVPFLPDNVKACQRCKNRNRATEASD